MNTAWHSDSARGGGPATHGPAAGPITRAEICVIAAAEIFRGAGEIMASPMSTITTIGARLARLSFEPDLLVSDGEALFFAEIPPIGGKAPVEGWIPFSRVFDVVNSGRRHVVMGANQIDRYGNQNLSAFGPLQHPTRQMFGMRGAPGNTMNHPTSYFVPRHSKRVFRDTVDIVCGIGYDKVDPENSAYRFHHLHRVVSNLGVFDFGGPEHTLRALSLHPGVRAEEVAENTSFEIAGLAEAGRTRLPTGEELNIIRNVLDPKGLRDKEVQS